MCAAEFFRQRPNFSDDLAENIGQKLATLFCIAIELLTSQWPGGGRNTESRCFELGQVVMKPIHRSKSIVDVRTRVVT
jgi:hypothetical protein